MGKELAANGGKRKKEVRQKIRRKTESVGTKSPWKSRISAKYKRVWYGNGC